MGLCGSVTVSFGEADPAGRDVPTAPTIRVTPQLTHRISFTNGHFFAAAALRSGTVVTADKANEVRAWDLSIVRDGITDRAKQIISGPIGQPEFLSITPCGKYAVTASSRSARAHICGVAPGMSSDKMVDVEFSCRGVAALGGEKIAVATADAIHIFNASTGAKLHEFREHGGEIASICASGSGQLFSCCTTDRQVIWYNTDKPAHMAKAGNSELSISSPEIKSLCPVVGTGCVAGCSADGSVEFFGGGSIAGFRVENAHSGIVTSACMYKDDHILTGGSDKAIKMWDTRKSPTCVLTRGDQDDKVIALLPLPDGNVVSVSSDKLHIWVNSFL